MDFAELLIRAVAVVIAMTGHELCHGLMAYKLGDPTAKSGGRLSLNPLRHIDPIGLVALFVFGFGWAKPVMVDMRYFKNPKRGMALTAAAGPAANFVMAYAAFLLLHLTSFLQAPEWAHTLLLAVAAINIGLGVFNLLPIPPLDGSKMLGAFLPDRLYVQVLRYERYGMVLLLGALWLGWLDKPLGFLQSAVTEGLLVLAFWG
jgi:Zn-dependent protease